ncbi:hypothetical protein HO965_01005 [Streptococcus suis]|nr:hypothetical protein [Streptococcus suis]WNF84826.1 hypothetical protein RJW52_02535 [Streptococcus suis]
MMKNKILVTDSISLEVSEKQIEVSTLLPFEIQVYFTESASLSLDADGKVLGKNYHINISAKPKDLQEYRLQSDLSDTIKNYRELKKFWNFVINNRTNLFEMAGYLGVLEDEDSSN